MLTVYFGDESPQSIPGLKAWYDATTINQADNTSVTAWLDQSGNEAHMYQSTTAAQPTLQTNELNGRPVVRFDGTDDFMNLTAPFDELPTNASSQNCCEFSPDGIYLAHANLSTSPYLTIYKRNGNVFNKLSNPSVLPIGTVNGLSWSNNGTYLVVCYTISPYIIIYKRSGDTFTKLSDPATLPTGNSYHASFTSDDGLLSIAHANSPFVSIYSRSGDTFTKLSNPATLPTGTGISNEFSPNNNYLVVGHNTSPYLTIYSISGTTFTKLNDPSTLPLSQVDGITFKNNSSQFVAVDNTQSLVRLYGESGGTFEQVTTISIAGVGRAVKYSPNNNFLAIGHGTSPFFSLFAISGNTYTKLNNPSTLPASTGRGVTWTPDNNTLVVSHTNAPFIQAYTFDGTTLTNLTKLNMFRNVGGGTVFVVNKINPTGVQQFYFQAMRGGANTFGSRITLGVIATTNNFHVVGRRNDSDTSVALNATSTANNTFKIHTALVDYQNTTAKNFINGIQESISNSYLTSGNSQNTDSVAIKVGAADVSTAWFATGDISEIIVYNRALSDNELKVIHQYLSKKWGIALVP